MNAVQNRFLLRIKKVTRGQGGEYRVTAHFVVKREIINKLMGRTHNRQTTMTNDKNTHTSLEKYLSIIPKASL